MSPERISFGDVLLAMLVIIGATLTVIGGMGMLFGDGERSSITFGIGVGMLFPLAGIVILRLLAEHRHRHDPPR